MIRTSLQRKVVITKLALRRETVRILVEIELRDVVGGLEIETDCKRDTKPVSGCIGLLSDAAAPQDK
jgi:hypothetical protein